MVLHALEDVEPAFAATRSLLTPIEIDQWLKLAFVAFFIGGPAGNILSTPVNGGGGSVNAPFGPAVPALAGDFPVGPGLAVAVIAVFAIVGLLFVLIGSVMEFVFVESIRTERIRIREIWRDRWRQGLRLFAFRLGLGLLFAAIFGGLAAFILSPIVRGPTGTGLSIVLVVLLVPLGLVVGLAGALVNSFTTLFVVPIMLLTDSGVLSAWRPLWASIRANPWQYAAVALVVFILYIAAGIVVGLVIAVPAFLLLLPVAPIAVAGFALIQGIPVLGILLVVAAAIVYGGGLLALAAVIQVPVIGFIRYYAMFVLGDIDPELDAIPEIRASIRDEAAG